MTGPRCPTCHRELQGTGCACDRIAGILLVDDHGREVAQQPVIAESPKPPDDTPPRSVR